MHQAGILHRVYGRLQGETTLRYIRGIWNHTGTYCKFQKDVLSELGGAKPTTMDFKWRPRADNKLIADFKNWLSLIAEARPDVIIVGMGVWTMRETNATVKGQQGYKDNLTAIVPYIRELRKHSHVMWIPQDPIDEATLDDRRRMLSNKLVNKYNKIAKAVFETNGIPIWWSSFQIAHHFRSFFVPGDCIHLKSTFVDKYKSQILVNWLCKTQRGHTKVLANAMYSE
ncbi:N-acetylneuraminate 9-O-acetyltransferase-like [Liolophura sinensis]|uniref:N-acetylneuraminate 9-O-acetyltransferase-like n=1 Tax=Liolophura sinensis TaxID=3198878 RepID=UPI003158FBF4